MPLSSRLRSSFFILITVLAGAALSAGCSHRINRAVHSVSVNSFAVPAVASLQTYFIIPSDERIQPGDLEFQEYSAYVYRALERRGMLRARTLDEAQVAIFLDYGYGYGSGPQSMVARQAPVWGPAPSAAAPTQVTPAPPPPPPPYATAPGASVAPEWWMQPPIVCYANLRAVDLPAYRTRGTVMEVWRATMWSPTHDGDLRRQFPIMMAGGWDLFAHNSGRVLERRVREGSPEVYWMVDPMRAATSPTRAPTAPSAPAPPMPPTEPPPANNPTLRI